MEKYIPLEFDCIVGGDVIPRSTIGNEVISMFPMVYKSHTSEDPLEEKRNRIFNNFKMKTQVQMINTQDIVPPPDSSNYFKLPSKNELLMMMNSIEDNGIISPVVLWNEHGEGKFTCLCGRTRVMAMEYLYENTKDEKYLFVPAFVFEREELDSYKARILILDSNISYRKPCLSSMVRAIIERYFFLKKSKKYKNKENIAEIMAKELSISKSTLFNYLTLRHLCDEIISSVCEGTILLKTAMILAKTTHEIQMEAIKTLGYRKIRDDLLLRSFIYEKETGKKERTSREVGEVKTSKEEITPTSFRISISCHSEYLGGFFDSLLKYKDSLLQHSDKLRVNLNPLHGFLALRDDLVDEHTLHMCLGKKFHNIPKS